jgi:hypothetical protein
MIVARVQQSLIESGFIAQQQEPFRIRIEAADWINTFGEVKVSEGSIWGTIRRKLREHAVRFVECEEHPERLNAHPPHG